MKFLRSNRPIAKRSDLHGVSRSNDIAMSKEPLNDTYIQNITTRAPSVRSLVARSSSIGLMGGFYDACARRKSCEMPEATSLKAPSREHFATRVQSFGAQRGRSSNHSALSDRVTWLFLSPHLEVGSRPRESERPLPELAQDRGGDRIHRESEGRSATRASCRRAVGTEFSTLKRGEDRSCRRPSGLLEQAFTGRDRNSRETLCSNPRRTRRRYLRMRCDCDANLIVFFFVRQ